MGYVPRGMHRVSCVADHGWTLSATIRAFISVALIDCGVDPAHVVRAALRRAVKDWRLRPEFVSPSEVQWMQISFAPGSVTGWASEPENQNWQGGETPPACVSGVLKAELRVRSAKDR